MLLKQLEQKRRGIKNESNGIISEMQREMLPSVSICCFYPVIWCLMVQFLTCIGIPLKFVLKISIGQGDGDIDGRKTKDLCRKFNYEWGLTW